MNFHEHYSELFKKLPPSIKKNIWNRITSKVHNLLSEEQASNINSDIEILLTSEVDKYTKKKNLQRRTKSILDHPRSNLDHPKSNLDQTEINLRSNLDQTEINLRPNLQETLNSIKQQKDAEYKQIRLDMAHKSRNLFELTLKKYIRDGTKDGRLN
ncbi:hypothetical protein Glove_149g112 [Diversispora epigaea]|uniref:Uncharacterized protein n=1 Tax=Diversispora epigaea TaxID=1348612 RepID=A0A397J389_9GLOM|nr:hypothetical protein Glove_149g112 [Diversispora epigaea]